MRPVQEIIGNNLMEAPRGQVADHVYVCWFRRNPWPFADFAVAFDCHWVWTSLVMVAGPAVVERLEA